MRALVWLLLALSAPAWAQARAGTDEWSLGFFAIGPKHYAFEGGASLDDDTDVCGAGKAGHDRDRGSQ